MSYNIKLIIKIVSNTLVAIVVVLAFLLHGFRLFGLTLNAVLPLKPLLLLAALLQTVKTMGRLPIGRMLTN